MAFTAELTEPGPQYIKIAQAPAYCGLSTTSIHKLINAGRLRAYRPVGGTSLISVAELNEVIRQAAGRPGTRGRKAVPA